MHLLCRQMSVPQYTSRSKDAAQRLLRSVALFLLAAVSLAAPQDECLPASCGDHSNVTFPFWIEEFHSPTCGIPSFKLTCREQTLQIVIANLNYTVKEFNYSTETLVLAPLDYRIFACLTLRSGFIFNSTPFSLFPGGNEVFFHFNCSRTFDPEFYGSVTCGGMNNSFVRWREENPGAGVCERVSRLPSAASVKGNYESWERILDDGFFVKWRAVNCSKCQLSGGKCRYILQDQPFGCLCGNKLLLDSCTGNGLMQKNKIIIGLAVGGGVTFIFVVLTICFLRRKRNKHDTIDMFADSLTLLKNINASIDQHGELINFDFSTIALATKMFSSENKIGAGGFGDVYKGILGDGQIVAVKRISFQSEERINEFLMEVKLIAKLQHRNLVRLLGYCIKGSERLLIYEFVPNKSLDFFIFGNEEKRQLLDWEKRISIIMGVARGLLYLHQDSRLRVIHRDLKAANILLDDNMNPKISDFGTARIFEHEQVDDNTIKIVGTRGYMSPEYIMNGNFSEKSDVFSFGVLALEITSGRRNKWLSQENNCMELLANAWILCMENEIHKLLDTTLNRPTQLEKVIRVIKVGLLCVQESPNDRPTMQEVVLMLVKEHIALPQPKRPGFFQYISVSIAFDCFPLAIDTRMTECQLTNTTLDGR